MDDRLGLDRIAGVEAAPAVREVPLKGLDRAVVAHTGTVE
jgi:hypothetical protein